MRIWAGSAADDIGGGIQGCPFSVSSDPRSSLCIFM